MIKTQFFFPQLMHLLEKKLIKVVRCIHQFKLLLASGKLLWRLFCPFFLAFYKLTFEKLRILCFNFQSSDIVYMCVIFLGMLIVPRDWKCHIWTNLQAPRSINKKILHIYAVFYIVASAFYGHFGFWQNFFKTLLNSVCIFRGQLHFIGDTWMHRVFNICEGEMVPFLYETLQKLSIACSRMCYE